MGPVHISLKPTNYNYYDYRALTKNSFRGHNRRRHMVKIVPEYQDWVFRGWEHQCGHVVCFKLKLIVYLSQNTHLNKVIVNCLPCRPCVYLSGVEGDWCVVFVTTLYCFIFYMKYELLRYILCLWVMWVLVNKRIFLMSTSLESPYRICHSQRRSQKFRLGGLNLAP